MPHQAHMTSLNQKTYKSQQHHPLMRAQHPNANVNPGAVGGPTQPPYGHPMNHHSQQMQETPSSIHQMSCNQHPAAYITNAPNVNVSPSTAQPTQVNYVGGGGGGPPTSMHIMTTGPGSSQGGAQVNVDNSNQQNHQYNRNQNEQPQALVAVPSTGGVPVVSEALTNTSNSGSSTVNTTKPARSKIVVKDPASKQVVNFGEWNKKAANVSSVYFPFQELIQYAFRNFSISFSGTSLIPFQKIMNGVQSEGLISYRKSLSRIKLSNLKLAQKRRGFECFVKNWSFEYEEKFRNS